MHAVPKEDLNFLCLRRWSRRRWSAAATRKLIPTQSLHGECFFLRTSFAADLVCVGCSSVIGPQMEHWIDLENDGFFSLTSHCKQSLRELYFSTVPIFGLMTQSCEIARAAMVLIQSRYDFFLQSTFWHCFIYCDSWQNKHLLRRWHWELITQLQLIRSL